MLKKIINIFFLNLLTISAFAQNLPKEYFMDISNKVVYTDINLIAQNPDSVKYIDLSKSKLKSFPDVIFQCENLIYLDLKRNKIEEIPPSIGALKKLRFLNLSRNKITRLPAEIGDCTELQTLVLNQNEIVEIPPQIGNLNNLEVLDLWGNLVDMLPREIGKISNTLKHLDMRVIFMSVEKQKIIESFLPETKIYFSQGCNCD
ncbi:MAG: leucine-rich repeat domain-containing protein [Bacteroidales bacterium]|jgi:Leucine-rich repeat (LRR) protein|nr:leucine-rich repeat domain-containing protein [Bacteroidales bacterium]